MKRICFTVCGAFFTVFLFVSCDLLRDDIFAVKSWSPGEGFHDPALTTVSLSLTLDPDRASVERSFSLMENGRQLFGNFSWKGSAFVFVPSSSLEPDKDYVVCLETGARDKKGLSLERRFEASFTTRPASSRPVFLGSVPADGGTLSEERETVTLKFSQAMNRSSLPAFVFSPQIAGVWSLEENGRSAVFTPSESWINGRDYRLTVDAAVTSERGLSLGKTVNLHFSAGADRESPVLLAAYARRGDDRTLLAAGDGSGVENTGWRGDHLLELVFSEPVDSSSVLNALSTSPSFGIALESFPGYAAALLFRFTSAPAWGSSFIVHLNNTVKDEAGNTSAEKVSFHIKADGAASKPPAPAGVRMPLDASGQFFAVYELKDSFSSLPLNSNDFPFNTEMPFWIELYFDAESIDRFSLMDCFRFAVTNNALSFSAREVLLEGFSAADAVSGWETLCRVEVRGIIKNQAKAGMITISVNAGLRDGRGNQSGEAYHLFLSK